MNLEVVKHQWKGVLVNLDALSAEITSGGKMLSGNVINNDTMVLHLVWLQQRIGCMRISVTQTLIDFENAL